MWIKSLSSNTWVNMNHITHLAIRPLYDPVDHSLHEVVGYLNASGGGYEKEHHTHIEGQAHITVKYGTYEECEEFIKEQLFLQSAWQWIGYLVAGGVGAILTLIFS